ncbi:MAG: hypothetical protein J6V50_03815, partial [Clostridia bacterium]|nr:hypothetical protein [Clostridia bacterium]
MEELVVKTHDFQLAKKRLKKFSEKKSQELTIETVETEGGLFWLGNHKVTGEELNSRLAVVQQHLIDLNNTNNATIKEFGQIYRALEALDKDYIQAILASLKATEATSVRIEATQTKIKKIVEDQKKTLEVLKIFKEKLDEYAHLGDIDEIWNDCQKWHAEIGLLSKSVAEAVLTCDENSKIVTDVKESLASTEDKMVQMQEGLNEQIILIEKIGSFAKELEKIIHLKDVDDMWLSLSDIQSSLKGIYNEIAVAKTVTEKQQKDIEKILVFVESVSKNEHLKDIDYLWESNETHANQIENLQKQDEEIKNLIHQNKDSLDKYLSEEKESVDSV